MAATVLNSERAVQMSVFVVRAFVRLREILADDRRLAAKIDELERHVGTHETAIRDLVEAIRRLMVVEVGPRRKIGYELPQSAKSRSVRAHQVSMRRVASSRG